MKKIAQNVVAVTLILLVATVVGRVGFNLRTPKSDAVVVEENHPTSVKVREIASEIVEDDFVLMGTLDPWEEVTLSAKTVGEIEWQGIEEGDHVEEGQELIRIDTQSIQVSLDQARAKLRLAARELERNEEMREEGISSPQARDRAVAESEVASTNLRAYEIKLSDSVVRAKISGVVATLYRKEGEYVNPGAPLVRVVQVDKVKLVIGVPERDVVHFFEGDSVEVFLDAFPGRSLSGRIHRIAATAEKSTHTLETEVRLDNPDGLLRPGMIGQARLVRQTFENSVMIPLFSLMVSANGRHIFVEQDGIARRRPVEVGILKGNMVQIRSGLTAGERLIIVGQRDLRDGDLVAVREIVQ